VFINNNIGEVGKWFGFPYHHNDLGRFYHQWQKLMGFLGGYAP
jgi:hypothetical protein